MNIDQNYFFKFIKSFFFYLFYLNKKYLYLDISLFSFFLFSLVWIFFDPFESNFQFFYSLDWFFLSFYFGLDGLSLFFLYLIFFLVPLCLLFSLYNLNKENFYMFKLYNKLFLFILFLLFFVFFSLNFFFFYICFEMILIPFFILIGINGFRKRRIHASYLFFFYTLFGSFLMLTCIFFMYSYCGSMNFEYLLNSSFGFFRESIIWLFLFISFAIKIPMFPFHIWLPEAHVEAPTEGSVLLAGVLLKLGSYGYLRFLFPLFPDATYYYSPFVLFLGSLGIYYTSFITLRQVDIKRVIAYSSISHMNLCVLGLFSFHLVGILGSIHLMIGHGLVSGGLFFLVGMLYYRFHTKIIKYYGGLIYIMPIFSFFFFLFTLGNISFPLTSNFIGEFLILISLFFSFNFYSLFFGLIGIFICTVYSIWLYNKLVFLIPSKWVNYNVHDLTFLEISILLPIIFHVFWLGIYPSFFFNNVSFYISFYMWEILI